MELLEKLAEAGFTPRVVPPYERHLGMEKYNCVALLEPTPEGKWKRFGSAGYLLDGQIALLVERNGQKVFIHKGKQLAADGQPLEHFHRFLAELEALLNQQ